MDTNGTLILTTSRAAYDLIALGERLREGQQYPNILNSLPNIIRDRIILQLEFLGVKAGQIKTIFDAAHPDPKQQEQAKKRTRDAWNALLRVIAQYTSHYAMAAYVVAAAKFAIDEAVAEIDADIARLEAGNDKTAGVKSQIKALKNRQTKLKIMREKKLEPHIKTLESENAPSEETLAQITSDIEKTLEEDPKTKSIFSRLKQFAPAAIQKVKSTISHVKSLADITSKVKAEKILEPEARTRTKIAAKKTASQPQPISLSPEDLEVEHARLQKEKTPEGKGRKKGMGKKIFDRMVRGIAAGIGVVYGMAANPPPPSTQDYSNDTVLRAANQKNLFETYEDYTHYRNAGHFRVAGDMNYASESFAAGSGSGFQAYGREDSFSPRASDRQADTKPQRDVA